MDELKSSEVGDSSQPKFRPTQGQPQFTRRQLEVLDLLVKGMTNKEISRELQMGFGTVKVHVAAILQVLSTWREVGAAGADIAITSAQISRRGQYQSHRAT
jgi:DNA-binding NarL/FixJ family response regulator